MLATLRRVQMYITITTQQMKDTLIINSNNQSGKGFKKMDLIDYEYKQNYGTSNLPFRLKKEERQWFLDMNHFY